MQVKDLKPKSGFDEITIEIVSKGEPRDFANANGAGKVCSCAAKDSEGKEISLTLWNEQCTEFNEGDKIKLSNGWTSEYQGQVQVSTGKQGTIEKV